jgi:hypothetical protein
MSYLFYSRLSYIRCELDPNSSAYGTAAYLLVDGKEISNSTKL